MQIVLASLGIGDLKIPIDVDFGEGQSGDESPHSKVDDSVFIKIRNMTGRTIHDTAHCSTFFWSASSSRSFGLECGQQRMGTDR